MGVPALDKLKKHEYLVLRASGKKRREILKDSFDNKISFFYEFLKLIGLYNLEVEIIEVRKLQDELGIKPLKEEKEPEGEINSQPDTVNPTKNSELKKNILAEFAKGKNAAQIERDLGMKLNSIHSKLKTLGIENPFARSTKAKQEDKMNAYDGDLPKLEEKQDLAPITIITEPPSSLEIARDIIKVITTDTSEGTIVVDPNPKHVITLQIRLNWIPTNRFDQRIKLADEADQFITNVEVHDIDFTLAASELFGVFQAFANLVQSELHGLIPRGNVTEKVVDFFEYHNELHLNKTR